MHDSNGKRLQVGDEFNTYMFGVCKILSIASDGESMCAQAIKGGDGLEYSQDEFQSRHPEAYKVRTWKEMATEALQVQDACNLSGVVSSFATIIREVRTRLELERSGGNDAIHYHPVCQLFADKIASLTGVQNASTSDIFKAYDWAHEQKGDRG